MAGLALAIQPEPCRDHLTKFVESDFFGLQFSYGAECREVGLKSNIGLYPLSKGQFTKAWLLALATSRHGIATVEAVAPDLAYCLLDD